PILERRKFITCGPGPRGEFLAEQITLCGKAFEPDFAVAVVFVADRVEIIQPPGYRQVGAPPILDPVEFDGVSDLKAPDLVRTTAKRDFQRRLIERLLGIVRAGENREPGDEQRHVACTPFGETYDDRAVIGRL